MDSPDENYITLNNYNFSLNEEFDYLDGFSEELERAREAQSDGVEDTIDKNVNGSGSHERPKPEYKSRNI